MPSSDTITEFNVFTPGTLIRSSRINANFTNFRGTMIPISPDTATSSDLTHDLGSPTHRWMNIYGGALALTGQSTPALNPTTGQYKVYMKSDGFLYRLNSSGVESLVVNASGLPISVKGDLVVHDGSASVRLPVGTNGQVLTADSSATTGVKWQSPGAKSIVLATTTYSVTNADDLVILSGSSFTATLFSITGNSNEEIEFLHNGTSFSGVYQIKTQGTDVISTHNGDTSTVNLYTNGERIKFLISGGKYIIYDHKAITGVFTETITIGAVTTPPKKGVTAIDRVEYSREGQYLFAVYRYKQSATTGSSAGSGNYLISLPASLQVDTNFVPFSVTTSIDHIDNYPAAIGFGVGWDSGPSTKQSAFPIMYDATRFRVLAIPVGASPSFMGSAAWPLTAAGDVWRIEIKIPIPGWLP